jgi:hypothetical protein
MMERTQREICYRVLRIRPTVTMHRILALRTPLLLIAATAVAILSPEIDQMRLAEERSAFFAANAVPIHREFTWIPLPAGLCSMALCALAWRKTTHKMLVLCYSVCLAPRALQF